MGFHCFHGVALQPYLRMRWKTLNFYSRTAITAGQ